ncbi:WAT1-related protein At4g28040-like [Humulus lupulus]|uniref:WAT1-related protein At4g28040-like n=1 Tax=Humulus lupulus TaxID=3486 RepID=UPI002B411137|nr:WAT1-related protein At4g28040-like [Humulus lupulus]XP_062079751.1 WAT1-related protein At4g28040-like [Humulus lupulus]
MDSSYKAGPGLCMVLLQFLYAGQAVFTKAALMRGMSPRVFMVYRQTVAIILLAPLVSFSRWKNPNNISLGLKGFCFIFLNALIGLTANHNAYYQGLKLSSSSITTAMVNLMPAITFLMASLIGLEKVNSGSLRGIAKIVGTVICIGGAIVIALVKGPTLLNSLHSSSSSTNAPQNLQLGCLFLFICCCCWSFWIIFQVKVSAICPDHSYSTLWMCFLATIQSTIFALSIDRTKSEAWLLNTPIEIGSCIFAGVVGALSFTLQTWCVSQRGPVFSAIFSPLCTVITTIIATSFLHEELYIGSLIGGFAVIIGLYVVLWGKAKDLEDANKLLELNQDVELQRA